MSLPAVVSSLSLSVARSPSSSVEPENCRFDKAALSSVMDGKAAAVPTRPPAMTENFMFDFVLASERAAVA